MNVRLLVAAVLCVPGRAWSQSDTLAGEIRFDGDSASFAIDISAGTTLRIALDGGIGYCLDDVDGFTALTCFQEVVDHHVSYPITRAGRYFLRVGADHSSAGSAGIGPYRFVLTRDPLLPAAGDPPAPIMQLPPFPRHLAVGLDGSLYIADANGHVLRIDNAGIISTIASNVIVHGGIAIDAFGDLLVSRFENDADVLWSISPTGTMVRLTPIGPVLGDEEQIIAVSTDGDIWIAASNTIRRLDARGRLKSAITIDCDVRTLTLSPTNDLVFTSSSPGCEGVNRVTPGGHERLVRDVIGELVFDRTGTLYIGAWDNFPKADPAGTWGYVLAFDPLHHLVDTVAHVPSVSGGLVFARDDVNS